MRRAQQLLKTLEMSINLYIILLTSSSSALLSRLYISSIFKINYYTLLQKYERLHKAFGILAEYYLPYGIHFYYTKFKKVSNEFASMSGKVAMYGSNMFLQQGQIKLFSAGGKNEDDLR